MTAIKLTFICATDSADEHTEILKYKLSHASEFKSHVRQYNALIGRFFTPNGACSPYGVYELVNGEYGLLSDFITTKFNQI